jgi:hypothetical protein
LRSNKQRRRRITLIGWHCSTRLPGLTKRLSSQKQVKEAVQLLEQVVKIEGMMLGRITQSAGFRKVASLTYLL